MCPALRVIVNQGKLSAGRSISGGSNVLIASLIVSIAQRGG